MSHDGSHGCMERVSSDVGVNDYEMTSCAVEVYMFECSSFNSYERSVYRFEYL